MSDPCLAGFVLGVGVLKGQAESGVRATRSWSWSWTGWKPALGLASRAGRPRNRRACRQQASELRPPRGSPVPVREKQRGQGRGNRHPSLLALGPTPRSPELSQFPFPLWEEGQRRELPSGAYTPPSPLSQPRYPLLCLGPRIMLPWPGEDFYWLRE